MSNIPHHKRFVYRFANCKRDRIGVIERALIGDEIFRAGIDPSKVRIAVPSDEYLFELTFRHGSEFVKWIDEDWQC